MHIAYLNLIPDTNLDDPEAYFNSSHLPHKLYEELLNGLPEAISVVQRATFDKTEILEKVSYYFVSDEFAPLLRWWQEPIPMFELLSEIQPDIIQVSGLNLPLQFRWLRRMVGDKIKIVGEHTGESIWASRNLWLQQFGLRVVDGFIFKNMKDAQSWTKASVILEKQIISEISLSAKNPEATAKSLIKFYNELLTTK